jgi:excisionase family DNA binding protein
MKRMTTREAAEELGVSPSMIRAYVHTGILMAHTTSGRRSQGQRYYFDGDEVAAMKRGGAPAAKAYREQQANERIKPRRGRRRATAA